jgi:hypothetical protein
MSKQLKYKLKKTLKNAEFVHADLEYHEELSQEALRDFQEEVNKLLAALSEEDQQRIQDHLNRQAPPVAPPPGAQEPEPSDDEVEPSDTEGESCTSLVNTDIELDPDESPPKIDKTTELKKLFRRIAERTHPDKVRSSGFSNEEVYRLERLFIRAREAHDNENWYTLYSIASELGLDIEDLSDEEIEWIEEDIKKTLAKIATLSNLTAWHWYVGDEAKKEMALKFYFQQAFGFDHPEL